jgi:hypothetical protein
MVRDRSGAIEEELETGEDGIGRFRGQLADSAG